MNKWFRLWKIACGTVRTGDKVLIQQDVYVAQWRVGIDGEWQTYAGSRGDYDKAYSVLEKHATPAILALRYLGAS